ncbi:Ku protein [Gluconacetobacter diazotrophicus]|uniref:Non-homologous end joining protein Ku n=1 Tax=Gluconacetobacter diazotrophicus TaxID=33996 RepID=A0A7W4I7M2_GLUDI|nr:Ku protein [Gluconacetobacter diazotrophicus]MBB2157657.1 Ku protein [Gluconacetobacter diazotrophicus]
MTAPARMTARTNWRGMLRIGALQCPVALYTAVSTSERIHFHIINRATGHRVRRDYIDEDTGRVVERDDQVKGYETDSGEEVILTPEDIAAAIPDSDKTLSVSAFLRCRDIDDLYLDRTYYLAPGTGPAAGAYPLIRDAIQARQVGALARTVLFRRMRTLVIRADGAGLVASTLHFDYEVRPVQAAFESIPDFTPTPDMLDLARHIIRSRQGRFDPAAFEDRYEAAVTALVQARIEGRALPPPPAKPAAPAITLMQALRESAGQMPPTPAHRRGTARGRAAAPHRKAG